MPNSVPEGEGLKNVQLAGQRKLGHENEEEPPTDEWTAGDFVECW